MKRSYACIWLYITVIIFVLLGSGCSKGKQQNVLVVLRGQADASYKNFKAVAAQWAKEKEIFLQVTAPKLPTVSEQQKTLENSIRKHKWDLIIIEPLGGDELYPLLDYAKKQGSIVVSIMGSPDIHADYIIQPCDYKELGTSMMDVFAEKMSQDGSYVTLVPSKDSEIVLKEELACISQQKNKYPRMMAVSRLQESSDLKTTCDMTGTLSKAYSMKGILFFSSENGLGISQWKKNTGNALIAVGIGDKEVMKSDVADGAIDTLFYWNQENLLRASIEVGYKAIEGKISNDSDVITTKIDGYRTLRTLGEGIYYGSDISKADNQTSHN